MIDLSLPREHAALLSAGMERHCPIRELKEGFALFRDNRVTHAWKDQFNIVHAIVHTEDGDRKLQLDLDFFLASECACGGSSGAAGVSGMSKICAHMAAVFFLMYGEHADPQSWLDEVIRTEARAGADPASGRPPKPIGGPPPVQPEPEEAQTPERWGVLIDREMERLSQRLGNRRRIDIFYMNACRKLFSFAETLPNHSRARFRLFATLRIMLHAEEHLLQRPGRETDPSFVKMVQDLGQLFADHAGQAAGVLSAAAGAVSGEEAGILLQQMRASLPPPDRPSLDWGAIHRLLWSQLVTDGDLRRGEIRRLRQLEERTEEPAVREEILLCIAHLYWLEGDDGAAMDQLAAIGRPVPERVAVYWETLRNTESWSRFKAWFSFALPSLARADGETFRRALEAAEACRDASGDDAFLRDVLAALLPRSADAYAACLMRAKRHDEWVSFHMLNGTPVDRIDREHRLAVERTAPRLMLPLYHQAIERLLAARNRTAYREIAKLARRLDALYRALGEEATFRAFLAELRDRNGRQHALMEELEKGLLQA